ncbi:hypothetical protein M0811_04660 [Anaeramoeba ignava]|uniref:Uncharacterized protein n=1 Tax=Anaeramoeba ignava TaxID=1746090 RepID=A0A9Q0LU18_ANAIG|nr:hypothetical protein M0811_04660 [Anaeramoeba ignava]
MIPQQRKKVAIFKAYKQIPHEHVRNCFFHCGYKFGFEVEESLQRSLQRSLQNSLKNSLQEPAKYVSPPLSNFTEYQPLPYQNSNTQLDLTQLSLFSSIIKCLFHCNFTKIKNIGN